MKKIIIRSVPLVLALILIFGLTVQNSSENVNFSERCRVYAVKIAEHLNIDTENAWWNTKAHFRKIGHAIEYCILGMGLYFALRMPIVCIILCTGVSFLDQYIKMHVPLRHFDITDIPFDVAGGVIGIFVMVIIIRCFQKRIYTS